MTPTQRAKLDELLFMLVHAIAYIIPLALLVAFAIVAFALMRYLIGA